jgi:predicted DNA-binding ribbon-helix-helix protein
VSGILKRSIMIAGHRTSISVEQPFWDQLKEIAANQRISTAALIATIDESRGRNNLSSAIRLHVLSVFIEKTSQQKGDLSGLQAE